jgi:8-oxo-dGTP pyrophosphatase MutT (NUDIX family)
MSIQYAQKAVILDKGKFLLVRKSLEDPYRPGMWEFPGGRVKKYETPDQALVREVREEVGMHIIPGVPLALGYWHLEDTLVICLLRFCVATSFDVDMSRNDVGDFLDSYGWFTSEEALGLDLVENQPIAQALSMAKLVSDQV